MKSYQPRTNVVQDKNGDVLSHLHSTYNRWKDFFCQLWNIYIYIYIWH